MLSDVLLIFLLFGITFAKQGFGPGEQDWGYADVREKAHIFWWLYYTTADVQEPTERPLIIWLQGGPGGSSTAYGNFEELGPLDRNLQYRNTTWVQHANILFVDSPVGTGFSYVEDESAYTTTNNEIAQDFLKFLKIFYEQLPKFKPVPLHIFSESYGGKMAAEITLVLDKAIKNGEIESNLKSVGLGDAWISPIDYVMTWPQYLLNLGFIDQQGFDDIMESVLKAIKAVEDKKYKLAYKYYVLTQRSIRRTTYGVDFYTITNKIFTNNMSSVDEDFTNIMSQVKKALDLQSTWGRSTYLVGKMQQGDFMKPVTDIVEKLLNSTDIRVFVYNGQLDLITDTPGTVKWVEKLNFNEKKPWNGSKRTIIDADGYHQGYVKKYGKFAFYWVNRAGHMVPRDNPSAMYYILKDVTNNFSV